MADDRCASCGVSKQQVLLKHEEIRVENARLRALYENVIDNQRFGFTINHLLECEHALGEFQARVEALEAQRDEARRLLEGALKGHEPHDRLFSRGEMADLEIAALALRDPKEGGPPGD